VKILVLNAGSSSQKSRLYEIADTDALPELAPSPLWQADADWTHHRGTTEIKISTASGARLEENLDTDVRSEVIGYILKTLWSGKTQVLSQASDIQIVGHRVVHGGNKFEQSTVVTPEVKATISRMSVLAPLHNPANLEGIEVVERILPAVPQVAVFDTAFHRHMPLSLWIPRYQSSILLAARGPDTRQRPGIPAAYHLPFRQWLLVSCRSAWPQYRNNHGIYSP